MRQKSFLKIIVSLFCYCFSLVVLGQGAADSPMFLRDSIHHFSTPNTGFSWYKFRAKGALLNFVGTYGNGDSALKYEIYPFANVQAIQNGFITPMRSVGMNYVGVTEEIWQGFVNSGICICSTCLSKLNSEPGGALKVKQGEFYFLKIKNSGAAVNLKLHFDKIDPVNPIQFNISDVNVDELEVGMVYQLKEIFFIPATARYLKKSMPELERLKLFLEKNKALKIQVRGHVNGPANTKPSFYLSLSNERAAAIKTFLVENGVPSDRIDTKGMSNFQMRFPSPKTAQEAEENRRVEIVIVAVKL